MHRLLRILRASGVIVVGDLEIVLGGDRSTVPDPRADHVGGVRSLQLGLAGAPQVLEQLWLGL